MWMEMLFSIIFFVLPIVGMFVMILIGGLRKEKTAVRRVAMAPNFFEETISFKTRGQARDGNKWKVDTS